MEGVVIDQVSLDVGVGSVGVHEALLETKAFHDTGYAACPQFHEDIAWRRFPMRARD
jgi:hypothetical protein